METYLHISAVWGVYLAAIVFFAGMVWRIRDWLTTPRSPVPLGMFPKPATRAGRLAKLLKDTFLAPHSARIEPAMWVFAMAFHVAALGAFIDRRSSTTSDSNNGGPTLRPVTATRIGAWNFLRPTPSASARRV